MNTQILNALVALNRSRQTLTQLTGQDPLKNNNWRTMMTVEVLKSQEGLEDLAISEGSRTNPDAVSQTAGHMEIKTGYTDPKTGTCTGPMFEGRNTEVYVNKVQQWDSFAFAHFEKGEVWPCHVWSISREHMAPFKQLVHDTMISVAKGSYGKVIKEQDIFSVVGAENVQHIDQAEIGHLKTRARLLDVIDGSKNVSLLNR